MIIKNISSKILNMLYPPKCPYCNEIVRGKLPCCESCEKTLSHKPIIKTIKVDELHLVYCLSPFVYEGAVKNAISRFKFRGQKSYAEPFAIKIAQSIRSDKMFSNLPFDVVTSVPLSRQRELSRGYNQAELLGKEISYILNLPYDNLLHKCKHNLEQHKLSAKERAQNVLDVYSVKNPGKIKEKSILLCDDIVTTGSTLKECAKMLYKEDAKAVYCVTLANAIKA